MLSFKVMGGQGEQRLTLSRVNTITFFLQNHCKNKLVEQHLQIESRIARKRKEMSGGLDNGTSKM